MASIDGARQRELTIVLTGAESSGKTTLAEALARRLGVPWVEEYARRYLEQRPRYAEADLLAIAVGQATAEARAAAASPLLVADTDLLVIKIWSEVRFGGCDAEIDARVETVLSAGRRRLYLIPRPDMPWQPDPLREHPHERMIIHGRHLALLERLAVDYVELTGSFDVRLSSAVAAISARFPVSQ